MKKILLGMVGVVRVGLRLPLLRPILPRAPTARPPR